MNAPAAQISIFGLSSGLYGRDAGIERVINSNETFIATARGIARLLARRRGLVTSDDVREVLNQYGVYPNHKNAYGGIFRGGEWEPVGMRQSEIPSNHGRWIRAWRLREAA